MQKGQVTVFIIIGIIALLLVSLLLYTQRIKLQQAEEVFTLVEESVPAEVQPVKAFVTQCVADIAVDGLRLAGSQGGYIDPQTIPGVQIDHSQPTESDIVAFSPDAKLLLPYWWQLKSPNTCTETCVFFSLRPPLAKRDGPNSIEQQLQDYAQQRLPDCVRSIKLPEGMSLSPKGDPEVQVIIARDEVIFQVDYPVEVVRPQASVTMSKFYSRQPVNLREMYDLATNITNYEAQYHFLERNTRQLIDAFGRVNANSLPPAAEFEAGLGPGQTWVKSDVQRKLQDILTAYTPLLQVFATKNYQYRSSIGQPDPVLFDRMVNRGMTIPEFVPHPDTEVRFAYLDWWQPHFDLNCDGELCQPDTFLNTFVFQFGFNRYNFAYDISYPVMVEMNNPNALNGRGFALRFFLEANMRDNQPMKQDYKPLAAFLPTAELGSLLCQQNQRTGGPVTASLVDARSKNPVTGFVVYHCGREACSIGKADNGLLNQAFPRCLGGLISGQSPDYFTAYAPLDVVDEQHQNLTLTLEPIRLVNVSVQKLRFKKVQGSWIIDTTPVFLADNEQAIITMQRERSQFEDSFSSVAGVIGGGAFTERQDTSKNVRLVPGKYKVSIQTFLYAPLTIPPKTTCIRAAFTEQCYTVPEEPIKFDEQNPFPNGAATFMWTVTGEELDKAKSIVFKTLNIAEDLVPESQREIEDISQIGKLTGLSTAYAELLKPEMS